MRITIFTIINMIFMDIDFLQKIPLYSLERKS